MKRMMILLAALLLICCAASAEEVPATYAEVRSQYGLPDFAPCNLGMMIGQNRVRVTEAWDGTFTRGVITYTGEDGERVTVEGICEAERGSWNWPEIGTGVVEGRVWYLALPADAVLEMTGEVPCGEGYRGELVYRRQLQENTLSAMMGFGNHMEYTGLRLYDQTGAKVLEVWPKAGEFELRCMAAEKSG